MTAAPVRIAWSAPQGELLAIEPTRDELEPHVPALAAAYNEPRNAAMLGHTAVLPAQAVRDHYATVHEEGGRAFLLLHGGALAGDADLRGFEDGACEFAFLVASPAAQGKGLGTAFATMIHVFAFGHLALDRIYASIIPDNVASRRVFEKLGYAIDDSPAARAYADEIDLVMSVERATFQRLHAAAAAAIRVEVR